MKPQPSILTQRRGSVAVNPKLLKPSPRHWNPGLLRYRDRLWLAYRAHMPDTRCETAIVELDRTTLQPKGPTQWLSFKGATGKEHHEDARLFLFRDEPYCSYTELQRYTPGKGDYTCVMKYSKLRLRGSTWEVVETWQPQFGDNYGQSREKNWVFFDHDGKLHCVYDPGHEHSVLHLDGAQVIKEYRSITPMWFYGAMRGGTPPVQLKDGSFLTLFHSSTHGEKAPHHSRYHGGAYTFAGTPPFAPLQISQAPIMSGSEADGHVTDPRFDGWKPLVVFPCGLVPDKENWLVSLGVNDHRCVVARMTMADFRLGATDGSEIQPRFFRHPNGSIPIRFTDDMLRPAHLPWTMGRGNGYTVTEGFMKCVNPRDAQLVAETDGVQELTAEEYEIAQKRVVSTR